MIIFISGMSSTGKTTLVNHIRSNEESFKKLIHNKFNKIIYVTELARDYFKEHNYGYNTYEDLLSNYDDSMSYFNELIDRFINKIYECNSNDCLYIIDRSPTDYVINLMLNYYQGTKKQIENYQFMFTSLCYKLLVLGKLSKDIIEFRTNPFIDTSIQLDGFRPNKFLYRRGMERMLFALSVVDSKKSIILLEKDTETRFAQIILEINKFNY